MIPAVPPANDYKQLHSDIIQEHNRDMFHRERERERERGTYPMGGVTPRPLASKCLLKISESSRALWTVLEE